MKKEIFKTLRCKCGKQSYEDNPLPIAPMCPRCGLQMKYSADWYIKVSVNGKRHIQKVGRQQRQAETVLKQAHTELYQKKFFQAEEDVLLLSEAILQVYDRKWKKKKDGAKSRRRAEMIQDLLGDIPLASFDEKKYYQMVSLLEARDVQESTINRYRAALKTILRHHQLDYRFIEMTSESGGRIRILTKEEESATIALFRDTKHSSRRSAFHEMPDFITVLVDTGMRANELLGLPPRDIDFITNMLTIWINKADKPRSIPMTSRVIRILAVRAKNESGKLFSLNIHQADKAWAWMRTEMKLEGDHDFVIHALRHTCATRLIVKGIDIYRVQKWMGHKSIKTTEKYLHLDPQQLKAAAAALEPDDRSGTVRDLIGDLQLTAEQTAAIIQILQGQTPQEQPSPAGSQAGKTQQ